MEATWLAGLGARCSCIGAALVFPLSTTRKETVFCDRQYHSCSLWLQSLWLSILPLICIGHIFPRLARGQAYNTWLMCEAYHTWFTVWISQLPCWLIHCIARQTHKLCAQEPWRCIQTFLYVWAPFLTVFWRRLEIIFRPMEIHWRTLGCHFCCIEQIPNIAHRQKKTIILPSRSFFFNIQNPQP